MRLLEAAPAALAGVAERAAALLAAGSTPGALQRAASCESGSAAQGGDEVQVAGSTADAPAEGGAAGAKDSEGDKEGRDSGKGGDKDKEKDGAKAAAKAAAKKREEAEDAAREEALRALLPSLSVPPFLLDALSRGEALQRLGRGAAANARLIKVGGLGGRMCAVHAQDSFGLSRGARGAV